MRHRLHVVPWLRPLGGLLFKDWLAITIGRDIWAWRSLDPAELAHELAHAAQWRRYGALFAVFYLLASFKAWRRGGRWYHDNPFEIDAREAAAVVRAAGVLRRNAVRIILLDPDDRLLVLGARDPDDGRTIWVTPGGGMEPGETLVQAARRELHEELGLTRRIPLAGPVWRRRDVFTWDGRAYEQDELFMVARLDRPIRPDRIRPAGIEGTWFVGARWLSVEQIAASPDAFAPRRLAELLPAIIRGDLPPEPIDTGV